MRRFRSCNATRRHRHDLEAWKDENYNATIAKCIATLRTRAHAARLSTFDPIFLALATLPIPAPTASWAQFHLQGACFRHELCRSDFVFLLGRCVDA